MVKGRPRRTARGGTAAGRLESSEGITVRYTVLIHESKADFEARTDEAKKGAYWAAFGAYVEALNSSGVFVSGAGLLPPDTSTIVRLRDGKREVQDGPYADTKEGLGGFFVIEAPDLDAALNWAARCPAAATGSVEVRPNLPRM